MFGWNSASQEEKAALEALRSGDLKKAYAALRPVIDYPGKLSSEKSWSSVWRTFADVADRITGPELAALARTVASHPRDPNALYDLGYGLVEQCLHGTAATVLTRAFELAPTAEPILTELVCALEGIGLNELACSVLKKSGMAGTSFFPRYLLSFNNLMCGRIADSVDWHNGLVDLVPNDRAETESLRSMANALRDMHDRAERMKGHSALDSADLRGWTYVVNNCLLTHLSEYGADDGMNGRYAYLQESPERLAEGIRNVAKVLSEVQIIPPRVYAFPDRDSEILARVTATTLKCDFVPWSPDWGDEPGILACYDLANVEPETLASLSICRPGHVLWCHACNWTQPAQIAPDIITYFHQFTVPPWAEQMKVDIATRQMAKEPALSGTCEEVAATVCRMLPDVSDTSDLEALLAFASHAKLYSGWLHIPSGGSPRKRNILRIDSPVKSSRFL